MHYYTFSALVFDGNAIKSAFNIMHHSAEPSTIVEFRKVIESSYAGDPDQYDQIIIPVWQELDKATYDRISEDMGRNNEKRAAKFERRRATQD